MGAFGVVFDIDALESGYGYGYAAWRLLIAAATAAELSGCSLSDGDVGANEYCIAVESFDPARLARVREAVARSKARGFRPLGVRFLDAAQVERAPLVASAIVDERGTLSRCTTAWIARAWTDAAAEQPSPPPERAAADPSSVPRPTLSECPADSTFQQDSPTRKLADAATETLPRDLDGAGGDAARRERILGGKYRILSVHRGGMGEVFIVESLESLRRGIELRLALKTFQDRYLRNEEALQRFEREALQWIHLDSHPNIVDALLVERLEGKPYIWLEFVEGQSLAQRLEQGPIAVPEAVDLALQFARGMSHAWEHHGLIHRDIKPANTMVTREGILKITDFGLSRLRASLASDAGEGLDWSSSSGGGPTPAFTVRDGICGTPAYMAPEAIEDPSSVDTRTDVYAFGVMFHEMLTGRRLFRSAHLAEMIEQHLHTRPEPPSRFNPSIPVALDATVLRCLEKSPGDRFATFADLAEELAQVGSQIDGWRPVAIPGRTRAGPRGRAFLRAIGLMQFGRYEAALAALERALDETGTEPEVAIDDLRWRAETLNDMSVCLLNLRRLEAAESHASRALALRPDYAEAWSNLGGVLGSLGRYAEGVAACDRAIELKAEWAEAHANRGANLTGLGFYDQALGCFESALDLDPHYWLAHVMAAEAKGYGGAPAHEILASLEKALAEEPRCATALALAAACLAQLGRNDEARDRIRRAVEIDPTHPRVVQVRNVLG